MYRSTIFPNPTFKRTGEDRENYDHITTHDPIPNDQGYVEMVKNIFGLDAAEELELQGVIPEHVKSKAAVGGSIVNGKTSIRPVYGSAEDGASGSTIPTPGTSTPSWAQREFEEVNEKLDALLKLAGVDM